jgi:hypothetical protein
VPGTGFEPAHLAAPPPEDGASTNFATRAGRITNIEQGMSNHEVIPKFPSKFDIPCSIFDVLSGLQIYGIKSKI